MTNKTIFHSLGSHRQSHSISGISRYPAVDVETGVQTVEIGPHAYGKIHDIFFSKKGKTLAGKAYNELAPFKVVNLHDKRLIYCDFALYTYFFEELNVT